MDGNLIDGCRPLIDGENPSSISEGFRPSGIRSIDVHSIHIREHLIYEWVYPLLRCIKEYHDVRHQNTEIWSLPVRKRS